MARTRLKYDPRRILQIIDKHKEHAQKAVKEFSEAMKAGNELDVASEDFNQGVPKSVLSEASGVLLLVISSSLNARI